MEQFITAAEIFPVAILIADAEGRIVLVNGKTETMFGYQRDELIGQTMEILIPERYRDRHVRHRQDYNLAPRTRLMGLGPDLIGRRKNGDEFPIDVSLSPAETDAGVLIISMVNDISARKQAEEEGKQSEERYRSLFQNAVFAIFRSTPAGYFTDANPALCSMLGGLPHMRGPELVERLKSRQPTMAVLYIVRFRRGRSSADEASELSGRFIQKPFRKDALLRKLEQTLARRSY